MLRFRLDVTLGDGFLLVKSRCCTPQVGSRVGGKFLRLIIKADWASLPSEPHAPVLIF
jgi:hypothetical protein